MKQKIIGRKFQGELFPTLESEDFNEFRFSSNAEVAALQKTESLKFKKNFEKAHLKAYLAGHKSFHFGYYSLENGTRIHALHPVKQEYIYEERKY